MADRSQELVLARLEILSKSIDALSKDVEAVKAGQQPSGSPKVEAESPWYVKWTQILAIPAALIAIFLQWGQFALNSGSVEKTTAETQKIQVEKMKTQAELQKILFDLQNTKKSEIDTPGLDETLNKLRSTIKEIDQVRDGEVKGALTNIFMRFIIIWFALQAVVIVIDIFRYIWSIFYITSLTVLWPRIPRNKLGDFIKPLQPVVYTLVGAVPEFIRWSVVFFIIFTAAQPIARQASIVLGQSPEFSMMIEAAKRRNFNEASKSLLRLTSGQHGSNSSY